MQHEQHQAIAELAYRLWESRGRPQGEQEQIWLDAEQQIAGGRAIGDTTPAAVIDKTLIDSFPASDPPSSHLPDNPPSNAAQKWRSAGMEPPGSKPSDDKKPSGPEKLSRR